MVNPLKSAGRGIAHLSCFAAGALQSGIVFPTALRKGLNENPKTSYQTAYLTGCFVVGWMAAGALSDLVYSYLSYDKSPYFLYVFGAQLLTNGISGTYELGRHLLNKEDNLEKLIKTI